MWKGDLIHSLWNISIYIIKRITKLIAQVFKKNQIQVSIFQKNLFSIGRKFSIHMLCLYFSALLFIWWCRIIYLWRKVVCFVLFCSYGIHQTKMLQIMFLVSLESSWRGGAHGLGSMTFGLVMQKFLNIEWFLQ
jgi:hypothetical protein